MICVWLVIFLRQLDSLLYICLCVYSPAFFFTIISQTWAEIRDEFEGGVVCFDDDQADDWMILVKLFITESKSSFDFSLTLSFIRWSTRSWNGSLFVAQLNNFGGYWRNGGETFNVKITEEWSKFKSRMLRVL